MVAQAREFDTMQLGLGTASPALPAPSLPHGSTAALQYVKDFIARDPNGADFQKSLIGIDVDGASTPQSGDAPAC